jgi:hypothetical protein
MSKKNRRNKSKKVATNAAIPSTNAKQTGDLAGFQLALNSASRQLGQQRSLAFSQYFESQDEKHPNCWADYGYPSGVDFDNTYAMYERNAYAKAIVDRPVDKCWQDNLTILTSKDRKGEKPNAFETEFDKFAREHQLWFKLKELDRMQSIGQYGALLVEVRDSKSLSDKMGKIRPQQIYGLKILSEAMLQPSTYDDNEKSERYSLPITYQLDLSEEGDRNPDSLSSTIVHYTRVIVWAEGAPNDGIYGTSSLENPFNTLLNIEKISGAGGEGYFKSARGSMTMNISTESDLNKLAQMYGVDLPDLPDAISEQVDDFNKNFDAVLAAQGVDFKPLQITIPSPRDYMDIYIDQLVASSGIPKTELISQQVDQRSSTENSKQWAGVCESRQNGFLTRMISKTIEWFMFHGALPQSDFYVHWDELYQPSMADKLELVTKMVEANAKHAETLSKLAMVGIMNEAPAFMFEPSEIREVVDYDPLDEEEFDEDFEEGGGDDIEDNVE